MKKYLLCLLLTFVMLFSSCDNKNLYDNVTKTEIKKELIIIDDFNSIEVYKFIYEEHQYLLFHRGMSNTSRMGVVHDPNCNNHKNNVNEIVETEENYEYTW